MAAANICGLELGDINHSKNNISKLMTHVHSCLKEKTCDWVKNQKSVTITLDIGTEFGIPLLAVLFISWGNTKLAYIIPLTSKKGGDLANACIKACTINDTLEMKVITENLLE